jgi:hypothetical protein
MKSIVYPLLFFIFLSVSCQGQSKVNWEKWNFLIGTWVGEGNGQPGQGSGAFTFAPDLDQHILVRKSHTGFPASSDRPAFTHDDLLIVYPGQGENPSSAVYFDNEGHVISYTVVYEGNNVVLTGEKKDNMPVFRLSYIPLDDTTVNVKFEMSQDGLNFRTYLEGKSKKVK